jgi:hypothetical protein
LEASLPGWQRDLVWPNSIVHHRPLFGHRPRIRKRVNLSLPRLLLRPFAVPNAEQKWCDVLLEMDQMRGTNSGVVRNIRVAKERFRLQRLKTTLPAFHPSRVVTRRWRMRKFIGRLVARFLEPAMSWLEIALLRLRERCVIFLAGKSTVAVNVTLTESGIRLDGRYPILVRFISDRSRH